MKIREGFVSNSSSSSFIIKDTAKFPEVIKLLEDAREDYYVFKDVMYTSFVSDGADEYLALDKLSDGEISGYDEDDFIEIEGTRGVESVWLPKEILTDDDLIKMGKAPYYISSKLYFIVERFFKEEETSDLPYSVRVNDFISELRKACEWWNNED